MAKDSLKKASTPEPFSKSKTSNWVARGGGLPAYIQHIAHDLMEKRGKSESQAIQMAIGIVKRWARGGGNVDANTRAAAAKAVAEWEKLKAGAHAKKAIKESAIDPEYEASDEDLALVEDAMYPLAVGDPVRESNGDLSLGASGVIEAEGVSETGAYIYDVRFADGTLREGMHQYELRSMLDLRESPLSIEVELGDLALLEATPGQGLSRRAVAQSPGQRRSAPAPKVIPKPKTARTRSGGASDFNSKHPRGRGGAWVIKQGASGDDVRTVQRKIGAKADGHFGEKTKQQVMDFQRKHGLQVDGIVGHQTATALAGHYDAARSAKVGGLKGSDKAKLNLTGHTPSTPKTPAPTAGGQSVTIGKPGTTDKRFNTDKNTQKGNPRKGKTFTRLTSASGQKIHRYRINGKNKDVVLKEGVEGVLDIPVELGDLSLMEAGFDEHKHPRGRGGKFAHVLHPVAATIVSNAANSLHQQARNHGDHMDVHALRQHGEALRTARSPEDHAKTVGDVEKLKAKLDAKGKHTSVVQKAIDAANKPGVKPKPPEKRTAAQKKADEHIAGIRKSEEDQRRAFNRSHSAAIDAVGRPHGGAPTGTDPDAWDHYIASAPNFAEAQDRMEAAVAAGVDMAQLLKRQSRRMRESALDMTVDMGDSALDLRVGDDGRLLESDDGAIREEADLALVETVDGHSALLALVESAVPADAKFNDDGTIDFVILRPCAGKGRGGMPGGKPRLYEADMLRESAGVWTGVSAYDNHESIAAKRARGGIPRPPSELAGEVRESWWDPDFTTPDDQTEGFGRGAVIGRFMLTEDMEKLVRRLPRAVKTSVNAMATSMRMGSLNGKRGLIVEGIRDDKNNMSVDLVTKAGAGGQVASLYRELAA